MKLIVGFCPSRKAPRYRTEWMGEVRCDHRPGCLAAKRERQERLERLEAV